MRVLVDDEGLDWDTAWSITERSVAYTNHTLLPEALERWSVALFERLLPRHLQIIYEINQRFLWQVQRRWPGDDARLARMSIIEEGPRKHVRMAHLATVGGHSVNGVAQLHSDLVKSQLLPDFYELWPERFNNKTNGVTPRRWLLHANPRLTRHISAYIGLGLDRRAGARPARGAAGLRRRRRFPRGPARGQAGQQARGRRSWSGGGWGCDCRPRRCSWCTSSASTSTSGSSSPACNIVTQYLALKRDPGADFTPRAYIFAGKAAPGYQMAKLHIRLLNDVAAVINTDPAVAGRLAMAFVPNYGVTLAQSIIPSADLSVQISTAGKEASGTSNMKFALNGALTLGTLDGANVEIRDAVGHDNFFLFGLTIDEVMALRARRLRPARRPSPAPRRSRRRWP